MQLSTTILKTRQFELALASGLAHTTSFLFSLSASQLTDLKHKTHQDRLYYRHTAQTKETHHTTNTYISCLPNHSHPSPAVPIVRDRVLKRRNTQQTEYGVWKKYETTPPT